MVSKLSDDKCYDWGKKPNSNCESHLILFKSTPFSNVCLLNSLLSHSLEEKLCKLYRDIKTFNAYRTTKSFQSWEVQEHCRVKTEMSGAIKKEMRGLELFPQECSWTGAAITRQSPSRGNYVRIFTFVLNEHQQKVHCHQ